MSHFIQDNQCIVETKDEVLLLIIKGGDNNCYSWNNNRVSSWSITNAMNNYEELMFFINLIAMEEIRGGMWQFQSLKNKKIEGMLEYESIVINRFKRAYNSRIKVDFNFNDITIENVGKMLLDIELKMEEKGFKIINEDGNYSSLYKTYITKSVDDFNDWCKYLARDYKSNMSDEKIKIIESYDMFVEKFKDKNLVECLREMEFIEKYVNTSCFQKSDILIESKLGSHNVSFDSFKVIVASDFGNFINNFEHYFEKIIKNYPVYIKKIKKEFLHELEKAVDTTYLKCGEKNIELLKSLSDEELDDIQMKLEEKRENEKKEKAKNAKEVFKTQWNSLISYSYYKNTNEKLPREVKVMNEAYETNSFKLEDINDGYKYSLLGLIYNHRTQYKKNQKAIKDLVQLLFDRYEILIKEEEKEELLNYFKIKTKKVNNLKCLKAASTIGVALYSQDLLEVFTNGTLF